MTQWMYRGGTVLNRRRGSGVGCAWIHAWNATPGAPEMTRKVERALRAADRDSATPPDVAALVAAEASVVVVQSPEDVLALIPIGPMVVTCGWMTGFDEPDLMGRVGVNGRRRIHTFAVVGLDEKRGAVRIMDSRGAQWGQLGRAWMPIDVLRAQWSAGSRGYQPRFGASLPPSLRHLSVVGTSGVD